MEIDKLTDQIEAGEHADSVAQQLDEVTRNYLRTFYYNAWWTHQGSEDRPEDTWPRYKVQCKSAAEMALVKAIKPPGVNVNTVIIATQSTAAAD